jgi:flagellar basal-body rod protein FlgF
MVSGLQTAASAMSAQLERLAVLANNLANVTAAGYKADRPEFFQLLTSPRAAGSVSPTGSAAPLQELPGDVVTRTDFSPGSVRETGNPLDVAIEGSGFFVVRTAAGVRLTRNGAFTRSTDGLLVTVDGAPVLGPGNGTIQLPEQGRIAIDEQGQITVDGAPISSLLVVDPPNPERLTKEGGTRFVAPAELALPPAERATVRQGALEQSNVNPIATLVDMIDALRVYEAAQRTARGVDETLGRAVNEVGRPA